MKFYYFNSTHWDREWYQPYQEFRKYLVDAARELLRIFDTEPEFRRFTFDGDDRARRHHGDPAGLETEA